LQVSLSIVGYRSLFNEPERWRRVMAVQLVLLLLMPPSLMTVGVFSFLQQNNVRSVHTVLYTLYYCHTTPV